MPVESVGPGGVDRSGGVRTTTAIAEAQRYWPDAGDITSPLVQATLDSNGALTT